MLGNSKTGTTSMNFSGGNYADFKPTRSDLRKLTTELKCNIWKINDELRFLKCHTRNLREELNVKKAENSFLLDLKSNEWADSAVKLKIRSHSATIISISKHTDKLKKELLDLNRTLWAFDDGKKTKHIHKLILEKKKLKSATAIIHSLLCDFESDDVLQSLEDHHHVYGDKLAKAFRQQMVMKSNVAATYQLLFGEMVRIHSAIYHYELALDAAMQLAIHRPPKPRGQVFVELAGFGKLCESDMIMVRIQRSLKSLWRSTVTFRGYTADLSAHCPLDIEDAVPSPRQMKSESFHRFTIIDEDEEAQTKHDEIVDVKLSEVITEELCDRNQWNTLRDSKYFAAMTQRINDHLRCAIDEDDPCRTLTDGEMVDIRDSADQLMLFVFDCVRNGFMRSKTSIARHAIYVEKALKLLVNWMHSVDLFVLRKTKWRSVLFEARQIAVGEILRYFDDFNDFEFPAAMRSAWMHGTRLLLAYIYDLCGVKAVYSRRIPKAMAFVNGNSTGPDTTERSKADLERIAMKQRKPSRTAWSVPKVHLDAFDELPPDDKVYNEGRQLWSTWSAVNKLSDCHQEFYETLRHRDPSSCKKIVQPMTVRYFTDVQLGGAIVNVWDKAITAMRHFHHDEEKAVAHIQRLGKPWLEYGVKVDHGSFNSVGLLLLEFVSSKHGSKWHARNQQSWIWALEIIHQALYEGATSHEMRKGEEA